MTNREKAEVRKQIADDVGFMRSEIVLLECSGKSYLSEKYDYVLFEVHGITYKYIYSWVDNAAELIHFDDETGHATLLGILKLARKMD